MYVLLARGLTIAFREKLSKTIMEIGISTVNKSGLWTIEYDESIYEVYGVMESWIMLDGLILMGTIIK